MAAVLHIDLLNKGVRMHNHGCYHEELVFRSCWGRTMNVLHMNIQSRL